MTEYIKSRFNIQKPTGPTYPHTSGFASREVLQFRATKNLPCAAVFSSSIMSSRKVVINGVVYVRSRDAAHVVNLAADYISRLARTGVVAGQLTENVWFVNLASLNDFIANQERQKQLWRAHLAKLRREEQRAAGHPSALFA